uniref:Uncharacterized protein n=1 Tax=Strongyloides papillosus TaxID=174720 RepID=A0A0N5C4I0_STREA
MENNYRLDNLALAHAKRRRTSELASQHSANLAACVEQRSKEFWKSSSNNFQSQLEELQNRYDLLVEANENLRRENEELTTKCNNLENEINVLNSSTSNRNFLNESSNSNKETKFVSLKVRAKTLQYSSDSSKRLWLSQVINAITESNLNEIPPEDVLFRLSQKIQQLAINPKNKQSFTIEETIKLYLNLNITQARFGLLLNTLKEERLSPFPSFNSVKQRLMTPATGAYRSIRHDQQYEIVDGIIATNIESIVKERICDLMSTNQLVYETTENVNEITINCCINGDKGQDTTKFNLQLETKENNHSVNNLSIIAMWFGTDDRKFMEYFLEEPMKQFDEMVQNGLVVEINGIEYKINIKPFVVADFMVLYNFYGLKGASSNHNCVLCERTSGGTRNRECIRSTDRSEEYGYRSLFSRDTEKGYREEPLSKTIPYENICIPMLHVFMGLVKDIYNSMTNEFKTDRQHGSALTIECENFLKSFKVPRQEFYQTFSGNGVKRFLENIEQFEQIFDSTQRYSKYLNVFKKISKIYKAVFKVNSQNSIQLSEAINELHIAYEQLDKISLTPKMHALLHHSEKELNRNGKLTLFSEQGLESQHSLIKRDLIRYQSQNDNKLKLDLMTRYNYQRTKLHDLKV